MIYKQKICSLSQARFRNYSPCEEPAEYRARATLNNGREVHLYLCPIHMPHAWELAQALIDRAVEGNEADEESVRLECISFYQLKGSQKSVRRQSVARLAA
jgi:hypothetical protein